MKTKIFQKISKALLRLSESVKNLSGEERRKFFDALGFFPFMIFLILWVILFFVDIAFASKEVHDQFCGLVVVLLVISFISWIIKDYWIAYPLYVFEREAVGCKFSMKRDANRTNGYITYNDHKYIVENFQLTKEDKLFFFNKQISPEIHAIELPQRPRVKEVLMEGSADEVFPHEDHVVKIYYDLEKCDCFFEKTEVKGEVYKSYEVISWIYFGIHLLMDFLLPIGYLLIALKNCC